MAGRKPKEEFLIDIKAQDQAIAEMVAFFRRRYRVIAMPIYGLILAHGRPCYMGERTFAGRRATRKQCYENAYNLADSNPSLTYVEGWCRTGMFIEHAWCIDPDRQVIDPTLREAAGYFGIPFRWEYVRATASRTKVYGVIHANYDYGHSDLLTAPVETFLYDPEERHGERR